MANIYRIIKLYHLFLFCEEVSFQEIDDVFRWDDYGTVSKKTIMRDINLLRKVGVDIRYSAKRKAYVSYGYDKNAAHFNENTAEARSLNKLKRFILLSNELPPQDCDIWYMENVPGATRRTMQRDFRLLKYIGYYIRYKRFDNGDDTMPPRHYYCDAPHDIYGLYDRSSERW